MKAFWRGKSAGRDTTRWSLFDLATKKEIKALAGYSTWDNARAEEASEAIAARIEAEAKALGYRIIENPID